MYDFANSGYTTIVLTAIYNAYFVGVIASDLNNDGTATFLWTLAVGISNAMVLLTAPVIGSIADHTASKKRFLAVTTLGCIVFTAMLAMTGPGDVLLAMVLLIVSNLMFSSGENIIAAFLPEISSQKEMGRISGYGWSLGYFGGMLVLVLCLAYIAWARQQGQTENDFVPVTMIIVAVVFGLAALPTFIWLKERAQPTLLPPGTSYLFAGFARLKQTLSHIHHYRDLFRFLITLTIYSSGIYIVIVLAAIYAREVMKFTTTQIIIMIIIVNISAAVGAFVFGHVQDRIGSRLTLSITLLIWIVAILLVFSGSDGVFFWSAANLIGIAIGSSQSAGRALTGLFTPPERTAEFFGLWGLAAKLAAVIGPLCYGAVVYLANGDHRLAILSTLFFFVAGLIMLGTVNVKRGMEAAASRV